MWINFFPLLTLWSFIIGMTWREFTVLRDQGTKIYMDVGTGLVDIPQIILYWIYIIFSIIANMKVWNMNYVAKFCWYGVCLCCSCFIDVVSNTNYDICNIIIKFIWHFHLRPIAWKGNTIGLTKLFSVTSWWLHYRIRIKNFYNPVYQLHHLALLKIFKTTLLWGFFWITHWLARFCSTWTLVFKFLKNHA